MVFVLAPTFRFRVLDAMQDSCKVAPAGTFESWLILAIKGWCLSMTAVIVASVGL